MNIIYPNLTIKENYEITYPSQFVANNDNFFSDYWNQLSKQNDSYILFVSKQIFHIYYETNIDYSFIFRFSKTNKLSTVINNINDFPDATYYWPFNYVKPKKQSNILYGTYYIQNKIVDYQNSFNCSNAQYLIFGTEYTGIGANIHVMGALLAQAINLNRVFVTIDNNRLFWIEKPLCKENSFLCYFERMSPCQSHIKNHLHKFRSLEYVISNPRVKNLNKFNDTKYIYSHSQSVTAYNSRYTVPYFVKKFCNELTLSPKECLVYWRIQSVTFITRYNKRFNNYLNNRLKNDCPNCLNHYDVDIHMRSGDKGKEMIIPTSLAYTYPLIIIQKILNKTNLNVYINGDSEEDIRNAEKSSNNNFIYIKDQPRKNEIIDKLIKQPHMTIYSFQNLKESLKSSIHVGTFESNWNRLIFELKLTIGYGRESLFFETGHGNCISYIDCHKTKTIFNPIW
ncbi:hypothetical protein WA158_005440 [Blastocystis sp. Blastoise]